jgi:hypothetical protein
LNAKTLEETTFIGIRPYECSGEIIVLTPIPANQVLGVGNAWKNGSDNLGNDFTFGFTTKAAISF